MLLSHTIKFITYTIYKMLTKFSFRLHARESMTDLTQVWKLWYLWGWICQREWQLCSNNDDGGQDALLVVNIWISDFLLEVTVAATGRSVLTLQVFVSSENVTTILYSIYLWVSIQAFKRGDRMNFFIRTGAIMLMERRI